MTSITGVLLAQLGTPAWPAVRDVRRYLREFLSDPRVIDLPAPARWLLVNGVIAPFRAPRSAHAYRAIWRPEGSPLRIYTDALGAELAKALGSGFAVEVGMRYGAPALADALMRSASVAAQRQEGLGLAPALLVPDRLRRPLARLLRRAAPRLRVLSHAEVPDDWTVRVAYTLGAKA